MRISTTSIYDSGTSKLNDLQAAMQKSQLMISTGKRILTGADDPVAAARALEVSQNQGINSQFAINRKAAQSTLGLEENTLQSVTSLLQDIKGALVQAGDAALTPVDLKYMSAALQGQFNDLLGSANSRDANGTYLFGGYQTDTQPFALTANGVTVSQDTGERLLQVASTRQMSMSDSGAAVFSNIINGNGNFVTGALAANTGTGTISPGTVVDTPSTDTFQVVFTNDPVTNALTYSVFNTTTDPTMAAAPESTGTYVEGQTISFDIPLPPATQVGARQIEIHGKPLAGDNFSIDPSTQQSLFTTMQNLITLLNTSGGSSIGRTQLSQGLSIANQNLDHALDNILTVRASIGARMQELDNLDMDGLGRNEQYAQTLSNLQDLDYTKAISDLSQQTTTLEAAQKSFVKVTGLSLFNYI